MEPFGLLNLLKSLLPQTENSTPTTDEPADDKGENFANNDEIPPAHNRGQNHRENENPNGFGEETENNAFLDFVSRHDKRKRQIKK